MGARPRSFPRGSGATPVLLRSSCRATPTSEFTRPSVTVADPEVVIVGAGVTGCAAALRLAQAGKRVRLVDAREGRVHNLSRGRPTAAVDFFSGYSRRLGLAPPRRVPTGIALVAAEVIGRARPRARSLWSWGGIPSVTETRRVAACVCSPTWRR